MDVIPSADSQSIALPRKRNLACERCRQQKIRCGHQYPSCSNCIKAKVVCIKPTTTDNEASREYIRQLEQRIQWLEGVVNKTSPDVISQINTDNQNYLSAIPQDKEPVSTNTPPQTFSAAPSTQDLQLGHFSGLNAPEAASLAVNLNAGSTPSQIGPSQPLAHDVGLLSLANSAEPKYLGPSSGVTFARLIFAAAPQSQGLSNSKNAPEIMNSTPITSSQKSVELADLPAEDEMRYFADAYFETWHPLYPFIQEEMFQELVSRIQSQIKEKVPNQILHSMDLAQLFLVIALGAKVLESRLGTDFSSESYCATAMLHVGKLQLHDSLRGVQVMLLLVLSSFSFVNGLNAWFLTSTILAACLDLGLQRKYIDGRAGGNHAASSAEILRMKMSRCGVFWSAYSLDRTLCVILGRPLTLRDEAIDIEYPGEWDTREIDRAAIHGQDDLEPRAKRICLPQSPYTAAIYSFRFDRITAEIKLMLYRVAQSPTRFPWPTNLTEWGGQVESSCRELLEDARQDLKWRGLSSGRGSGLQDRTIRLIEWKFHQCIMLLSRPSPAIPQPSSSALVTCYESAIATLRIQSELARFANMTNSWLTAHAVFVSGITMLYCIWTSPEVRKSTSLKTFLQQADSCTKLLSSLGKTWSVAKNAQSKFDHLVQVTNDSWKSKSGNVSPRRQSRKTENNSEIVEPILVDNSTAPESFAFDFWEELNADYSLPQNLLVDELGDMGTWFDLDWLGDTNFAF